MIDITPIPAFTDNYIWALSSKAASGIVVVDPGDAKPVLAYCQEHQTHVRAILVTHHHWDHAGGVVELVKHFKNIPVYGSPLQKVPGINHPVHEGDEILIDFLDLKLKVMEIPGHTLDHVAYYNEQMLFCGDTLFSCGCGRVFEGTMAQMVNSLAKLKALSPSTLMYCGHEYTEANIRFAKVVDPTNRFLQQRETQIKQLRKLNEPTLPITMQDECLSNPFLRCEAASVIQAVQAHANVAESDPITIFTHLRTWKNHF